MSHLPLGLTCVCVCRACVCAVRVCVPCVCVPCVCVCARWLLCAGTRLVHDIRSGPQGSDPRFLINLGGVVIFTAYVDNFGHEIWRSDGSGTTTTMVRDIFPGPSSSNPNNYVVYNGKVYFQADDGTYVCAARAGGWEGGRLVALRSDSGVTRAALLGAGSCDPVPCSVSEFLGPNCAPVCLHAALQVWCRAVDV